MGFQVPEQRRQFWFFWLLNQRSRQCLWKEWPHCPLATGQVMLGSDSRMQWLQICSSDSLQMLQLSSTESLTQLATAFHLVTVNTCLSAYIERGYYYYGSKKRAGKKRRQHVGQQVEASFEVHLGSELWRLG
jgi:hypothetical protein